MAQITEQQAKDKSTEWLSAEPGFSVDDDGTVTVDGNPPLTLSLETDAERLIITHVREEPAGGAGRVDAVMAATPDRGTTLHVAGSVTKTGVSFTFTNPVYLDGFSRQALVAAVNDLIVGVDSITGGAPAAPKHPQEAVAAAAVVEEVVEPTSTTDETPEEEATAEVAATESTWSPSHRVPAGGMRAWGEPDPSLQPSSRLEARVELQIAERRGDWARVVGSNGWTGWVDARKLEDLRPSSGGGGGTIDIGQFSLRPLPLIGALALAVSAFLPWLSIGGGIGSSGPTVTTNSFEIALSFLWDYTASGSPYLGIAILVLAAGAVVMAGMPKPNPNLTRLLGVITVAVAALFLVQMYRGVSDGGGTFGDVFDLLGFAPWVMLGSGGVLLAAAKR